MSGELFKRKNFRVKSAILKASRAKLLGKYPIFKWPQPRREGLPLPTVALNGKKSEERQCHEIRLERPGLLSIGGHNTVQRDFSNFFFPFFPASLVRTGYFLSLPLASLGRL
ncbi:hypothetical protein CDAR_87591 [Caerostris darwini]|uniref:Uncharacterized protein n=1 Tax=Caerostris darwini TaxID=1538125 RepID=A0AAV4WWR0_9ARAC|nr:hypothetical protein CDAR_87591 [Caerostris darwini]